MEELSLPTIAEFSGGKNERGGPAKPIRSISTDSRTIAAEEFFVPLRGENFDGHKFLAQVIERGAAGALVDQSWQGDSRPDFAVVRVADTLVGYQQIAANYRKSLPIKV